jgi:uncharacterized surface protein with fasciclin (FAS1) repeats
MKKSIKLLLIAVCAVGIFGITGCEDHQARYETPPWLGGSSIETLEERGNYTTFLALMEKANYTEPISKQLFTLFVPDDAAFEEYFKSAGITSVNDLSKDEAVQLFTLHVLRNPRSRFQLIYEWAWAELQGPKGEYASLFHRKETPSRSTPYSEVVEYYPPDKLGQELIIYTNEKNVPLFTEEFFFDFGGAPDGSDYLYMYPGSTWKEGYTGDMKGMNWHNAQIIPNPEIPEELEVRTASGFIYFLDRVVPPMPSIEEYMIAHPEKYGVYYDILQRFALYGNQRIDEQNRVQFRKSYDQIFNLAEERGPSTDRAVPAQNMWSAILPPNDVLQNYLDNGVLIYYESIDSVPRVTLYYILQTQLSPRMVLYSHFDKPYYNAFGDAMQIDKADIVSGYMTSNGPIYESRKVLEPNVFTCVPGILFIDKNYSTLLYALNEANMLSTLSNPEVDVTLFATTNDKLEEYGIRFNETNTVVEFRSPIDGKWNAMNNQDLVYFAQDQIYKGRLGEFSDEGFFETTSQNYIYVNNNTIYAGENQAKEIPASVVEVVPNELNGYLVKIDYPITSRYVMGQFLTQDDEVSMFTKFLTDSRLLDTRYRDPITKEVIPNLKFLAAAKLWTGFIPTNEAMEKAIAEGIIPEKYPKDSDAKDSVNNWIMYHFVKDDVVFDDGLKSGNFTTNFSYRNEEGVNTAATVFIENEKDNLIIQDMYQRRIQLKPEKANYLVRKGVCHKIDTVFKIYE